MKKNFVKKTLASTLALAMVATAMPAAFTTASAASAPKLNRSTKTLYINENEIGSSYNFNVKNKVKKSTYKWTTSNKAIATVNSKNGVTKAATKTGKATITCKITLPTKKTKTLKATVTVKENATKVEVTNMPTDNTVGIGATAYDFNSKMTSASGAKATDYRTWEIDEASNTAGATIDAKTGVVSTTKAGSFKVRVRAYQNKTKLAANDTVDSEWAEIKVVSSLVSVAQTSVTKVAVTFDDNMKDVVKAENFAIKNKATSVVSGIKGLSFSDDGKIVYVETFGQFADNGTYVLTYGEKDYEFTTTIGEVASIEVTTTTVVENKESDIKYVLKNANGIDITDAKNSTVEITEVENTNGYLDAANKKITIFTKGSTAKIKVTYHTYKWEGSTEVGAVSVDATITAVEETAATVGNFKNYVIADKAPNWDKVTENKNVICVGETKDLYLKALDSDNKDVTGLTFETGNENILLVSTVGDHASLTAVKEGSTVVVVKNEKGTVLWSLQVVIKATRKANAISLASNSVTLTTGVDAEGVSNTTVEVKIKDQHGDDFAAAENFSDPVAVKDYTGAPSVIPDGKNLKVDASAATAGSYQFKVALNEDSNKITVLTVVVKDKPTTAVNAWTMSVSTNTVDSVVDADTTETKSVPVKVIGKASGIAVENSECTLTVTGPNNYKETYENKFDFKYVTVSNGVITKLAKGTYTITATKTIDGVNKTIGKTAIVVSDSQVAPTVTVNKNTYSAASISDASILECLQANCTAKNSAGTELKAGADAGEGIVGFADEKINGTQVYVKTVKVAEKFGELTYVHDVVIAKTFTIK